MWPTLVLPVLLGSGARHLGVHALHVVRGSRQWNLNGERLPWPHCAEWNRCAKVSLLSWESQGTLPMARFDLGRHHLSPANSLPSHPSTTTHLRASANQSYSLGRLSRFYRKLPRSQARRSKGAEWVRSRQPAELFLLEGTPPAQSPMPLGRGCSPTFLSSSLISWEDPPDQE